MQTPSLYFADVRICPSYGGELSGRKTRTTNTSRSQRRGEAKDCEKRRSSAFVPIPVIPATHSD